MGSTTPKTERDRIYRSLASQYLTDLMERRELLIHGLADVMGVDRSVASRYLSGKVRTPLKRLQFIERSLQGEKVPESVVEAFWLSEGKPAKPSLVEVDFEDAIRSIGDQLSETMDDRVKARARKQIQGLLKKLA